MDQETSIAICGLIAGILSTDKDMQLLEASFLQRMRKRFALPPGAAVKPITDPEEAIAKLKGFPEDVRKEAIDALIQAAAVDGKLVPAEQRFLGMIAGQLGEDIGDRLEKALAAAQPQPFGLAESSDDS